MLVILFGNKKSNKPPTFLKKVGGKGFSVIEILIVIGIIVTALTAFLGVATFSLSVSASIKEITIADAISKETIEAVRNFRDGAIWDAGLGTLIPGDAYYPQKSVASPPAWILSSGEETINGFTRKVVFERVSRNPTTKDIENSYNPANNDPDTRKAIITVFWGDKKVEIVTYITNWKQ